MAKQQAKTREQRGSRSRRAVFTGMPALALIASAVMGAVLAVRICATADVLLTNAKARIESSVAESFAAGIAGPSSRRCTNARLGHVDKVTMLDQVNEHFGYFRYVIDDEMNVWDVTGLASSPAAISCRNAISTGQGLSPPTACGWRRRRDRLSTSCSCPLRRRRDDGIAGFVWLWPRRYGAHPRRERRLPLDGIGAHRKPGKPDDAGHVGLCVRRQVLDLLCSSIAFGMTADNVERELMALNPVSFWTVDGIDVRYHGCPYR